MLEYDMVTGEFLDEDGGQADTGLWNPRAELYAELRLISVEEAEAERRGHLRR